MLADKKQKIGAFTVATEDDDGKANGYRGRAQRQVSGQ
jgi:hypothetical protein